MKERKLKVYQAYSNTNRPIPQIMLKGQWLKDFGFDIGTNIEVRLIENMLVIKQIEKEEKEAVKTKRK
ncbi:MAG: SymE family type I addiction module toxin [Anaerocolumna sp.]